MSRRKRVKRFPQTKADGVESVHCRICGVGLRVISGRHLAKHDITRET